MKNIFTSAILIILILSVASCSSYTLNNYKHKPQQAEVKGTDNDKNRTVVFHEFNANVMFTLEDLAPYFSNPELLLVPQGEDEYPKLNGVEAKAYELIDGGVYIHVFNNNEELKKGASQVQEVYDNDWGALVYEVNNMLFVYIPFYATDQLKKENDNKMRRAIKKMIKSGN